MYPTFCPYFQSDYGFLLPDLLWSEVCFVYDNDPTVLELRHVLSYLPWSIVMGYVRASGQAEVPSWSAVRDACYICYARRMAANSHRE
jgi:hypothetical protein